jgi:hypothetical protein
MFVFLFRLTCFGQGLVKKTKIVTKLTEISKISKNTLLNLSLGRCQQRNHPLKNRGVSGVVAFESANLSEDLGLLEAALLQGGSRDFNNPQSAIIWRNS